MKLIKKMLFVALFGFSIMLSSCGEEDDLTSCSEEALKEASEELLDDASDFANNPTRANCDAYKVTINDYIDKFKDCPGVTDAEIDQLRAQVAQIDCSSL